MTVRAPGLDHATEAPTTASGEVPQPASAPKFILYLQGPEYGQSLRQLTLWVHHVLLPVYGREVTSMAPWCSRWWEHREAVAQLHALWLAWGELSDTGSESGLSGPASWHRDYLNPVMHILRDPSGPFMRLQARLSPCEGVTARRRHRPVRPAAPAEEPDLTIASSRGRR